MIRGMAGRLQFRKGPTGLRSCATDSSQKFWCGDMRRTGTGHEDPLGSQEFNRTPRQPAIRPDCLRPFGFPPSQ